MNKTIAKKKRNRILVVDDNVDVLDALSILLQDAGFEVRTMNNGEDLLGLKDSLPDLILLDVLLSGMDGRDVARTLKKSRATKHLPIIMISAHPNIERTVRDYGADDFLPKPFEMDELLEKINSFLYH